MQILARKTKVTRSVLQAAVACVLSLAVSAVAQDPTPQPSPAASATPAGTPHAGTPSSTPAPASSAAALDYLFNRKPQDGSIAKQAAVSQARVDDRTKAASALGLTRMEDPQLRARFDRYLGMPEVMPDELRAYAVQLEKVADLLKKDKVFDAWKQLHVLAGFEKIDAGVSRELANRIEAIWNTDRASSNIQGNNQKLQDDIRKSNWSADSRAEWIRQQEVRWKQHDRENGGGKKNSQANNGGVPQAEQPPGGGGGSGGLAGLEGKLQLTEEYLRSLEAKARIKLNELKIQKLFDSAKSDFSSYVATLYGSHRHQHVVLAADFYRRIFKEDSYPVELANQVNASLEVSRDVQNALDAFNYKLGRNELAGATDRLQEAFTASEFNPVVLGVSRKLKEHVADFTSRLSRMQSLIEAHDFGSLQTLIEETKPLAIDFDPSKPLAIVNAVKLESRLRLGKAKLAAQQGDLKLAMEEFQAAAEAWPANPALEDSAGTFFDTQDVKNKSLVEFDRLVADQNIRAIFEKQLAFAPAIHGDAKREEQLKKALLQIKGAEIAYEKANLMRNAGDVFGAWETIEGATADLPNDNKLNMLRAELSGKGAEFVAAINKAKDAEAKKELGYSLSCYAIAQHYYPASTIANAGLQRLSQQILSSAKAF